MKATSIGNPLIAELLVDPDAFTQRGRPYLLLQAYFAGLPVGTLRPLLRHENLLVRQAAVWIASELGGKVCPLLDDVVALVASDDRMLNYYALEVATVCAVGPREDRFIYVPRALETSDDVVRRLAMRLLTRADQAQIDAAARLATSMPSSARVHEQGLLLLGSSESCDSNDVQRMLTYGEPLARRYGAIAAVLVHHRFPDLLALATKSSDETVRRFAQEAI